MQPTDRFATNSLQRATVHIVSPERMIEDAEVEYCVSSGYVRARDASGDTRITHISNVVIEFTGRDQGA